VVADAGIGLVLHLALEPGRASLSMPTECVERGELR